MKKNKGNKKLSIPFRDPYTHKPIELKEGMVVEFPIEYIIPDVKLQVRAKLDPPTVDRYASAYLSRVEIPPVQVAMINGLCVLVDGWHRIAAMTKLFLGVINLTKNGHVKVYHPESL